MPPPFRSSPSRSLFCPPQAISVASGWGVAVDHGKRPLLCVVVRAAPSVVFTGAAAPQDHPPGRPSTVPPHLNCGRIPQAASTPTRQPKRHRPGRLVRPLWAGCVPPAGLTKRQRTQAPEAPEAPEVREKRTAATPPARGLSTRPGTGTLSGDLSRHSASGRRKRHKAHPRCDVGCRQSRGAGLTAARRDAHRPMNKSRTQREEGRPGGEMQTKVAFQRRKVPQRR